MAGTNEAASDGAAATPLLVSAPPPVESKDRHVRALLSQTYHQFSQWKLVHEGNRAALTRLLDTLDALLPVVINDTMRLVQVLYSVCVYHVDAYSIVCSGWMCIQLTGARDFAGAAKVLSIMYHRFTVAPALCVQVIHYFVFNGRITTIIHYNAMLNLCILTWLWVYGYTDKPRDHTPAARAPRRPDSVLPRGDPGKPSRCALLKYTL